MHMAMAVLTAMKQFRGKLDEIKKVLHSCRDKINLPLNDQKRFDLICELTPKKKSSKHKIDQCQTLKWQYFKLLSLRVILLQEQVRVRTFLPNLYLT